MDALSDVLKSVRLEGAVYLTAEFTTPWCIRGECGLPSVRAKLAGAEHVAFFHYLTEGSCKVRLADGGEIQEARAGDLILFPQEGRHLMGSDLQLAPMEAEAAAAEGSGFQGSVFHMRYGGGGAVTRFTCGYLACSRAVFRPLFDALPRMLCIPMGDDASAMMRMLLQAGVRESSAGQPGGASMLAKLAEFLFVEAMRRHLSRLPSESKGWLAAVRDAHVGKALALLHAEPERPWTVDSLAQQVALSRSALAERFTTLIGEAPMHYLTRWRLALAARTLRSGSDAISRIAERSGYESEAAFNRAFKREFGVPPAAWRRAN